MTRPDLGRLLESLMRDARVRHPRSVTGIEEAIATDPERFRRIGTRLLEWAVRIRGEAGLPSMLDSFALFSNDVNLEQARYELTGHYTHKTYAECYRDHYLSIGAMTDYLWGIYLTNFMWSHHLEIWRLYEDRFLSSLSGRRLQMVELAPGHGAWGVWALDALPQARLEGYDISPSAVADSTRLAAAAGVSDRAVYAERNALDLDALPANCADALVCCFVVEHLEEPESLVRVIAHLLKPGGRAFFTGALTAAQVDHLFEFKRESELLVLCETQGLRVQESLSVHPRRQLPRARYLPRSMALILLKPDS